MATAPTTERGRSTRRRIVTTACEVVAEKGAAAASLDEVGARVAGVTQPALTHYSEDKNDLLRAVAEETNDVVLDGQQELFGELGSWEGLRRWTDALVDLQHERADKEAARSPIFSVRWASATKTSAPSSPWGSTVGKHPFVTVWRRWRRRENSELVPILSGWLAPRWPACRAD